VRNTTIVPAPKTPEEGYHLSEDLADDAIAWLHRHQAFELDKPLFTYWASGCLQGPHHVMKEWADKHQAVMVGGVVGGDHDIASCEVERRGRPGPLPK